MRQVYALFAFRGILGGKDRNKAASILAPRANSALIPQISGNTFHLARENGFLARGNFRRVRADQIIPFLVFELLPRR